MPQRLAISRLTTRVTVTLSVLLALAFPVAYFVISYQYMVGTLEAEAEMNSRVVSGVISANPLLWRYEQLRLEELLARRPRGGIAETRRILDEKGETVAESSGTLPPPLLRRSYELLDAGVRVGSIEISRSLRPLLERTGLAALLGICFGLLVFRLLPYREIVRAQKKIEDANAFLHMVMESSTNAIVVLDLTGRIRLANRRASELSGFSRVELVGIPFGDLFRGSALERVGAGLAKITAGAEQMVSFETELSRWDGRLIELSCGAAPFTENGVPAGIVVSAEDITSRKQWEQQLQRAAAELELSNSELRSFAYIISHDLRAPLVNIKGFASELNGSLREVAALFAKVCSRLEGEDRERSTVLFDQDIPEALNFINSSVVRMDRLINAILRLSRLGHRELKVEPVLLQELVDAILKSISHQIEEHRCTVTVGELPELHSDRIALEQIVGNLLDNAVKYLDPVRPGELEISGESDASKVTIHVRDNGRGIAREDMSKVFEIFRRAGRQDVQGEGMGLAYVKTLVRKLRGQIWCHSELGVGSTFSFSIPHAGGDRIGVSEPADGGEISRLQEGESRWTTP
jgi:PAS domain S-box-containing protein